MRPFTIALAVTATLLATGVYAGVIIDPIGIGDDDVTDQAGNPIDLTTDISALDLFIGFGKTGELRIDLTTNVNVLTSLTNNSGIVGQRTGSKGTVTVTGAGSTWTNRRDLFVGEEGTGALNIQAGGTVINTQGFVGKEIFSVGVVTVAGADSRWTNSDILVVGELGEATLNIEAGGAVSNTQGFVGDDPDSLGNVTVVGTSSQWTNSSSLFVGRVGQGTLNIEAGGAVSNTEGFVGQSTDSMGTVTVTGADSTWTNSSNLYVGGSTMAQGGTSELNVNMAGSVDVASLTKVWGPGSFNADLEPIPHGDGQTILREALLVADHNAYHLGQLVVVRRALGAWPEE